MRPEVCKYVRSRPFSYAVTRLATYRPIQLPTGLLTNVYLLLATHDVRAFSGGRAVRFLPFFAARVSETRRAGAGILRRWLLLGGCGARGGLWLASGEPLGDASGVLLTPTGRCGVFTIPGEGPLTPHRAWARRMGEVSTRYCVECGRR